METFYCYSEKLSHLTYLTTNGYLAFRDSHKLVHRWIAEKKLGRPLKEEECVHHINRNKLDNSPWNLHVFPNQAAHDRAHRIDAVRYGWEASYLGFKFQRY